jgi:hypothetical protein
VVARRSASAHKGTNASSLEITPSLLEVVAVLDEYRPTLRAHCGNLKGIGSEVYIASTTVSSPIPLIGYDMFNSCCFHRLPFIFGISPAINFACLIRQMSTRSSYEMPAVCRVPFKRTSTRFGKRDTMIPLPRNSASTSRIVGVEVCLVMSGASL